MTLLGCVPMTKVIRARRPGAARRPGWRRRPTHRGDVDAGHPVERDPSRALDALAQLGGLDGGGGGRRGSHLGHGIPHLSMEALRPGWRRQTKRIDNHTRRRRQVGRSAVEPTIHSHSPVSRVRQNRRDTGSPARVVQNNHTGKPRFGYHRSSNLFVMGFGPSRTHKSQLVRTQQHAYLEPTHHSRCAVRSQSRDPPVSRDQSSRARASVRRTTHRHRRNVPAPVANGEHSALAQYRRQRMARMPVQRYTRRQSALVQGSRASTDTRRHRLPV